MADDFPTWQGHQEHGFYSSMYKRISVGVNSTVDMLICEKCHYIKTYCNHDSSTWNEDGTHLACDFCGIDGT